MTTTAQELADLVARILGPTSGGSQQPDFLTSPEVAELLGIAPRTLDHWAYEQRGPRYHKFGRARRYRRGDLEEWIATRRVDNGRAAS